MGVTRLFTGFPWNLLGVSQFSATVLIQIASITGVYGVSFLVAWFSVSCVGVVLLIKAQDKSVRGIVMQAVPPIIALSGVIGLGL